MRDTLALVLLALLASTPWQGIGYRNHVGWNRIPLGTTGVVMVRPTHIPICLHMDWKTRRMMRPVPGVRLRNPKGNQPT